jgi:hypothetical protein
MTSWNRRERGKAAARNNEHFHVRWHSARLNHIPAFLILDYDDYLLSLLDYRGSLPLYFQDMTGKVLDELLVEESVVSFCGKFKMPYREGWTNE